MAADRDGCAYVFIAASSPASKNGMPSFFASSPSPSSLKLADTANTPLAGSLHNFHTRKEYINDGVRGAFKFAIAFALRYSREETVESIPGQ